MNSARSLSDGPIPCRANVAKLGLDVARHLQLPAVENMLKAVLQQRAVIAAMPIVTALLILSRSSQLARRILAQQFVHLIVS